MADITMEWVTSPVIILDDNQLPVRQVYVWYLTPDGKFLLVSKDGKKWQLPGGKPGASESLVQTAVREMQEETGLSIADEVTGLTFFGYYRVTKHERDGSQEQFLQVRLYLKSRARADELNLSADGEDWSQAEADQIMHVCAVTSVEACNLIPWLSSSGEYRELKAQDHMRARFPAA